MKNLWQPHTYTVTGVFQKSSKSSNVEEKSFQQTVLEQLGKIRHRLKCESLNIKLLENTSQR
jgi:hypothetical protein